MFRRRPAGPRRCVAAGLVLVDRGSLLSHVSRCRVACGRSLTKPHEVRVFSLPTRLASPSEGFLRNRTKSSVPPSPAFVPGLRALSRTTYTRVDAAELEPAPGPHPAGPHPAASPFDKGVGQALGVRAFGMYQVELSPGADTERPFALVGAWAGRRRAAGCSPVRVAAAAGGVRGPARAQTRAAIRHGDRRRVAVAQHQKAHPCQRLFPRTSGSGSAAGVAVRVSRRRRRSGSACR
jgi:hypothetical protein